MKTECQADVLLPVRSSGHRRLPELRHSRSVQPRWRRSAGLLVVRCLVLLALIGIPDSLYATAEREKEAELAAASDRGSDTTWHLLLSLLLTAAFTTATFLRLQASDPGYLDEDVLRRAFEIDEILAAAAPTTTAPCDPNDGDREQSCKESEQLLLVVQKELIGTPHDDLSHQQQRDRAYRLQRVQQIRVAMSSATRANQQGEGEEDNALELGGTAASSPTDANQRRFCVECGILPPLRAQHCRACGKCVATFDHHCYLLGVCVGERNHACFWWFLALQSLETALALAVFTSQSEAGKSSAPPWICMTSLLLTAFLWVAFVFVFGLWVFHTFLALTSSTTFEIGSTSEEDLAYLGGFRECDLPFSRGALHNLAVFCGRRRATDESGSRGHGCSSTSDGDDGSSEWQPTRWQLPRHIERDSDSICSNLWENRYYSCC